MICLRTAAQRPPSRHVKYRHKIPIRQIVGPGGTAPRKEGVRPTVGHPLRKRGVPRHGASRRYLQSPVFFVYWLWPSGLLLRELRAVAVDLPLAVPRPADTVERDDLESGLLCAACERAVVLLVDDFIKTVFS